MMYYRARYFLPEIGRFAQEDSDPGSILRPGTIITKYSYGLNNPNRYVDPTGKSALSITILALKIITASIATIVASQGAYKSGKEGGLSNSDAISAALATGLITIALIGVADLLGPVGAAIAIETGVFASNIANQYIGNGYSLEGVSLGRAAASGLVGGLVAYALPVLGSGLFPNLLPEISQEVGNAAGALLGSCIDPGTKPYKEGEGVDIFCSITIGGNGGRDKIEQEE